MKSAFLQKHSMISVFIVLVTAAVAQMSLVEVVHAQGTWTQQISPATHDLARVSAVNQNVAWACGNEGTVLRCIDGSTWTKVDGGAFGTNWLGSICAINANTALISFSKVIDGLAPRQLGDTAWIYRTTNGGSSWQIVFQQIGGMIEGMRMIDSLDGFACGDPTPGDSTLTVLRTRDGGAHWSRIATEPLAYSHTSQSAELGWSMAATDTNHIWFATQLALSWSTAWTRRTTDGGKTWNRYNYRDIYRPSLCFSDSVRGLSIFWGGAQAGCDRTTDGGQTWTTVYARPYTSGSNNYGTVCALPGGRFWMTDSSNVYEVNAGDTLQFGFQSARKTRLTCPQIYSIDMKEDGGSLYGWLATQTGKIFKYEPHRWQFNKYAGNPVLKAGPAGSWDENAGDIFGCSVMYHNSKYHMWYGGYKGSVGAMGYAYSDDGITWTKYSGNPVFLPGAAGDFDATIGGCSVLFYSGKFHMWYNGSSSGTTKIGYAYSDDGIHWIKHPTYVFEKGTAGAWDEKSVAIGSVIKEDSVLKMFYMGKSTTSSWFTGLATSPDSIHWTRQNSGNPVLAGGLAGAWDQYSQNSGTVIKNSGLYEMWYDNQSKAPYCIGYASSTNGGLNWSTCSGNPILTGDAGTWDAGFTIYPMVVRRPDGHYLLYYTGANSGWTIQSIGLAIDSVTTTIVDHEKLYIPASFALLQNYPNPFNPTTVISYQLPVNSYVTLKVYDLLGREVAVLVNEKKDAGHYSVQWNASGFSSGIYFYRLEANEKREIKKMVLLK